MIDRNPILSLLVALGLFLGVLPKSFAAWDWRVTNIECHHHLNTGIFESLGYQKWEWLQPQCKDCQLLLAPLCEEVATPKVIDFMNALSEYKAPLRSLYLISNDEYNLLAHMAVGILGRESMFFTSLRYQLKEAMPWAVSMMKVLQAYLHGDPRKVSKNSRGPTQIKIVKPKIARQYDIHSDNLAEPKNAAIATMGFLIEALAELKRRIKAHDLQEITPERYVDFLPYIYFGRRKALVDRTATPESNIYVQEMKKYMSWFQPFERQGRDDVLLPFP